MRELQEGKNDAGRGGQGASLRSLAPGAAVFDGLKKKTLRQLVESAREIDVRRGKALFRAGEEPSGLYIVLSGCVKLVLPRRASERESVVALLRAGEAFDISALFLDGPHLTSAITVCRTRLAHIPKKHLAGVMQREPELSFQMAKGLSRRVNDLLLQLRGNDVQGSGPYRFVTFLVRQLPDTLRTGKATITLPGTKRALASKLRLTPEHFSRVQKALSASGLIFVDGPQITINDVSRLRRYARTDAKATPAVPVRKANGGVSVSQRASLGDRFVGRVRSRSVTAG